MVHSFLQVTKGACNPNLQAVVTHAWHGFIWTSAKNEYICCGSILSLVNIVFSIVLNSLESYIIITLKQRKIKFKPRKDLNHNIYNKTFYKNKLLEAEIFKMLGTSHYLSPGGRGCRRILGYHLIFRRTKGGISCNWEPKTWGGSRKLSKAIREDYFSEVTFKVGSVQFHLV